MSIIKKETKSKIIWEIVTTIITLCSYYFFVVFCINSRNNIGLSIANMISDLVGILFFSILYEKYVPKKICNNKWTFIKFFLYRFLMLLVDIIIMFIFVILLKHNDCIIKLLSQIVITVSNCLLINIFVYKERKISLCFFLDKAFFICLLGIIFIGFSTIFRSPKKFSYLENRTLNKFEVPTIDSFVNKSFQDKVEGALSDQILFGQTIRKKGTEIFRFLDLFKINPTICRDQYVYISQNYVTYNCKPQIINAPRYDFDGNDLINSINIFNEINNYTDTYYYVLDRSYAWDFSNDELVLDGYTYLKEKLKGDYHLARLSVNSYNDYSKYFYQTDHHWNHVGSYQGYKDIVELLKVKEKPVKPTGEITLDNKFYGSMAKNSKAIREYEKFTYYDFDLKEHSEYINGLKGQYGKEKGDNNIAYLNLYAYIYGNDSGEIVFDFDNNKKDNLLIIGSSYTNPINKLVASHYNKTYILDPRYYRNYDGSKASLKEYIDDYHIDKVLILVSTDILDGGMKNLEWGD